jgi:hypothetical protein
MCIFLTVMMIDGDDVDGDDGVDDDEVDDDDDDVDDDELVLRIHYLFCTLWYTSPHTDVHSLFKHTVVYFLHTEVHYFPTLMCYDLLSKIRGHRGSTGGSQLGHRGKVGSLHEVCGGRRTDVADGAGAFSAIAVLQRCHARKWQQIITHQCGEIVNLSM